jgi:hypothetical protein
MWAASFRDRVQQLAQHFRVQDVTAPADLLQR